MKDLLNRLFMKFMSHMNGDKAVLSESAVQNVTPEWIVSLKENEIFVFGCRKNSGIYSAEECSFRGNNRNNESYEFSYIGSHSR